MKNTIKRTIAMLGACMFVFSGAACGGNDEYKDKKKISASIFFGEFGVEWLENLAEEWNSTTESGYYVDVDSDINLSGTIASNIKSGSTYDFYINEDCGFQQLIRDGYLEDLSDLLSVKPDGTVSIQEKIKDYEKWQSVAAYDEKMYMLPYNISPVGLVYNHDRFIKNGWLLTDADGTLTAGKDGVKGTYDDGQPTTMAEFKTMLSVIKVSNLESVFAYMGSEHPEYVNNIIYAYLAQYLGEENYEIFLAHDSNGKEVKMSDGSKQSISIQEGYKTWQMDGMIQTADFIGDYLVNSAYVSDTVLTDPSFDVDASHVAFIKASEEAPAFLVEGNWWEYGSYALFESNVNYGGKGWNEDEYRYMLLPDIEGQASEKSVFFSQTGGSIIVPKQNDSEKIKAIKEFLTFMLKDDNMAKVTANTGMMWNYNYTISSEQEATMTKFTKNTYKMMQDKANIQIYSTFIDTSATPIYAYSALGTGSLMFGKDGQTLLTTEYRRTGDTASFLSAIQSSYVTMDKWEAALNQAKSFGFYKD